MLELLVIALVVTGLVLANGVFVAAEFAILAAPRASVQARAQAGDPAARAVQAVLEDPRRLDRYIATAQVGITLASLGLGMYGEHALAEWLDPRLHFLGSVRGVGAHAVASVVAVAVLTYLHIVVGEMVPKALALQHAQRTALRVMRPMQVLHLAFYPLVVVLNAAGNGVLRLLGVRRELAASRYHSPEELQTIVEESRSSGALREVEGRLLRESLQFSDLTAGEAMVPRVRVTGLRLEATSEERERAVLSSPHTRYPVFEENLDHIAGVVHIKDLLGATAGPRGLDRDGLREVPFVPESASLDRVLEVLRDAGAHMAVVMDEHGGTAGIITMEDLLEEIVGDIEEDPHRNVATRAGDGSWLVPGSLRLDELGDLLGCPLSHPEVDTVGGLVLDALGRPPAVGDAVEHDGVRIEVVRVAGRGVDQCRVQVLPGAGPRSHGRST